jgi:hypothetical protein
MRKTAHSAEREKIVAEALSPVATELRLIDAADLVSLLRYERWGNISDLVTSAAELYFLPGTVRLGAGGDYRLDWDSKPEILLDLELKPDGVTIYAKLSLADVQAGVEINHITFHRPSVDADTDTAFLAKTLSEARFVVKSDRLRGSESSH